MKTVVLQIDDLIFDEIITFLQSFPRNRLKMLTKEVSSEYISAAEQHDIESILQDQECFVIERTTTVTI